MSDTVPEGLAVAWDDGLLERPDDFEQYITSPCSIIPGADYSTYNDTVELLEYYPDPTLSDYPSGTSGYTYENDQLLQSTSDESHIP